MDAADGEGTGSSGLPGMRRDVPVSQLRLFVPGYSSHGSRANKVRSVVGSSNRREHDRHLTATITDLLRRQPPQTASGALKRSLTPLVGDRSSMSLQEFYRQSAATPGPGGATATSTNGSLMASGVNLTSFLASANADASHGGSAIMPPPSIAADTSALLLSAGKYVPPCDATFRLSAADHEVSSFERRQRRHRLGTTPEPAHPNDFNSVSRFEVAPSESRERAVGTRAKQAASCAATTTTSAHDSAASQSMPDDTNSSMWRFLRTVSPLAPSSVATSQGNPPSVAPPTKAKLRQEVTDYHNTLGIVQPSTTKSALFADERARFDDRQRMLGHGARAQADKANHHARYDVVLNRIAANAQRVADAYAAQDEQQSKSMPRRRMFKQSPTAISS